MYNLIAMPVYLNEKFPAVDAFQTFAACPTGAVRSILVQVQQLGPTWPDSCAP
jgi:hypothetical protein